MFLRLFRYGIRTRDNYKIGCQDLKKEFEEPGAEYIYGTICLCDSKDECNKVPCTEEGLKRAAAIKHRAMQAVTLLVIAICILFCGRNI